MAKKLIINAIEPREIRAAIVQDDMPLNFFVERSTRRYQKGNIYRARVTSIEPHLQAAFVELEKGQHGFLSLSDVIFPDGGLSLIQGLPEPPLPESVRKEESKKEPEKIKAKESEPKPQKAEETSEQSAESFFDDTPEFPLIEGPKPPKTTLSDVAGNWLLDIDAGESHNPIIEIERTPEELEAEAKEAELAKAEAEVDAETKESEQADADTKEPEQADADTKEPEQADAETKEPEQADAETKEPEQAKESEQADAETKEPEQAGAENNDVVEADAQTKEREQADAQTKEREQADAENNDVVEADAQAKESEQADAENNDVVEADEQAKEREQADVEGDAETKFFEPADGQPYNIEVTDIESAPVAVEKKSHWGVKSKPKPKVSVAEKITASEEEDPSEESCVDTAIFEIEDDLIDDDEENDIDETKNGHKNDEKSGRDHKKRSFHSGGGGRHGKHKGATLRKRRAPLKIEDVLEIGQYITVQITKEGIGNKAPMVSTFISLAGHYMVLTPGGDRSGVSRQVKTQQERSRLRTFIEESTIPDRCGLIVRTAAENVEQKDLEQDIAGLAKTWSEIQQQYKRMNRSGIIRKEEGLTTRLVRDYYNQDIDEVLIDDPHSYQEIREFFQNGMSEQLERVKLYEGDRPIFYHHNLESSLGDLFRKRVNLPGGGSLIFDQGEAMLVIDINSGTFKEGTDDEDTAFRLNMLACPELARQIKMRDVGGIIMIDFVDMRRISSRNKVERELEKHFKGDKAKINIMSIGALGVLQMSRQRTKDSLRGSLYSTCQHCEGTGLVPSQTHSSMGILREIRGNLKRFSGGVLKVATTSDMAVEILNNYRSELVKMEEEEGLQIVIDIDPALAIGQFKLASKATPQRAALPRSNRTREDFDPNKNDKRNKKKKRRKDFGDEESTPRANGTAEASTKSSISQLEKLEKKFPPVEPLGIIKVPQEQPRSEQKDDAVAQDQHEGQFSEKPQEPSSSLASAEPTTETSANQDESEKNKRAKRLYKGAKGSARNPNLRGKKKTPSKDLKKDESDKNTPPAPEAE